MRRTQISLLGLILAGALVLPLAGGGSAEAKPQGVRFFAVDWRLSWTAGSSDLTLTLRGRTKGGAGDLGDEFEITTTDVSDPVMDILKTCGMGRLNGTATVASTKGEKIIGDKLTSLSCRAILN